MCKPRYAKPRGRVLLLLYGVCEFGGGADFAGESPLLFRQGAEVALNLDAVPELGGLAEEGAEADRHGRGDGAFAEHDLVDGSWSHTDAAGYGVL